MRILFFLKLLILIPALFLSGCGYQLGLAGKDDSIKNIYIYTVINETRKPGLEMPMTNALINSIHNYGEGIKVVSKKDDADTFLVVKLTDFDRAPARFNRANIIEESIVTLYAEFKVYKTSANPFDKTQPVQVIKPFMERTVTATENYFLVPNQPEGEKSIQPLVLDKLSREIIDQIVFRWENK